MFTAVNFKKFFLVFPQSFTILANMALTVVTVLRITSIEAV